MATQNGRVAIFLGATLLLAGAFFSWLALVNPAAPTQEVTRNLDASAFIPK